MDAAGGLDDHGDPDTGAHQGSMLYESGASCAIRGANPASWQACTIASRTADSRESGNVTMGSPASSRTGTSSRAASG